MALGRDFLIIGHRGAAGLAPENTLRGFRTALELGVDAIELDIWLIEEALVVFHDDRLQRTTNGRGAIATTPLARLRSLDAGDGERIPLLEEALELIGTRAAINIELKGPDTAAALAARLPEHGDKELLVSSFDHGELARFHRLAPALPTAPIISRARADLFETAAALSAWSIHLSRRIATAQMLAAIHARGYRSLVYTVNDAQEAQALQRLGTGGVFTDYPDRLLGAI